MTSPGKRAKPPMTEQHKQALKTGREEGKAVRQYLEALAAHRPKRGRKRTVESIQKQLAGIESRMATVDQLTRVQLIQDRMNLQRELAGMNMNVDLSALEEGFAKAAKAYGQRKGLTYAAWREAGVDAGVLKKAGISRSGS